MWFWCHLGTQKSQFHSCIFHHLLYIAFSLYWDSFFTKLQARKYIADTLGDKYAEGVILDMEKMWEESQPRTPMVGLLSMGSDPTAGIEAMAKKHKIGQLSMGR